MSLKLGVTHQVKPKIGKYKPTQQQPWVDSCFIAAEQLGASYLLDPGTRATALDQIAHDRWQESQKTSKSNTILLKKEELQTVKDGSSSSSSSATNPKRDELDTMQLPYDRTPSKASSSSDTQAKSQKEMTPSSQSIDLTAAKDQAWEEFTKEQPSVQKQTEAEQNAPATQKRRLAFIQQQATERLNKVRFFYINGVWEGAEKNQKRIYFFQLMENSLEDYKSTVDSVARGDCLTLWENIMMLGQPTAQATLVETLETLMTHHKQQSEGFQQWFLAFETCIKQIESPPSKSKVDEHLKLGLMYSLMKHDKRYDKTVEELIDQDKSFADSIAKLQAKAINLGDNKTKTQKGSPSVRGVSVPKGPELKQLKDKLSKEITAKVTRTMCCSVWHKEGKCNKRGDGEKSCPFAHLNKHLPSGQTTTKQKNKKKTSTDSPDDTPEGASKDPCWSWKKSQSCGYGDSCHFAHVSAVRATREIGAQTLDKRAASFNGVKDEIVPLSNAVDSKTTPIAIGDVVSIAGTNGKAKVRITLLFAIHRKVPELYLRGELHLDADHGLGSKEEKQIRDLLTHSFPCKAVLLVEDETHKAPAQEAVPTAAAAVNAARARSLTNVTVCLDSGSQLNLVENLPGIFVPGSRSHHSTTSYGGAAGGAGSTDFTGEVTLNLNTGTQNVPFHHATTADGVPRVYLSMGWLTDNMNAYAVLRKNGAWILSDSGAPLDGDGHVLDPADKGSVLLEATRQPGDTCEFPKLWDLPPTVIAAQSKRRRVPRVHSIALAPSSTFPQVNTRTANADTDVSLKGGVKTVNSDKELKKVLKKLNFWSAISKN